jgi:hypothetical protein
VLEILALTWLCSLVAARMAHRQPQNAKVNNSAFSSSASRPLSAIAYTRCRSSHHYHFQVVVIPAPPQRHPQCAPSPRPRYAILRLIFPRFVSLGFDLPHHHFSAVLCLFPGCASFLRQCLMPMHGPSTFRQQAWLRRMRWSNGVRCLVLARRTLHDKVFLRDHGGFARRIGG